MHLQGASALAPSKPDALIVVRINCQCHPWHLDLYDIYVGLWKRAVNAGAWVHYYTWAAMEPAELTHDHEGASGWFRANAEIEGGQAMIDIYRLECDDDFTNPSRMRGPEGAQYPPPDLEYELITLAHEYGHLLSYLGETLRADWERYTAAANKRGVIMSVVDEQMPDGLSGDEQDERRRHAVHHGLTNDERERIVAEEALAWKLGRAALVDLKLENFERFDDRERTGLHMHRYRLGMEDAWPGDDQAVATE